VSVETTKRDPHLPKIKVAVPVPVPVPVVQRGIRVQTRTRDVNVVLTLEALAVVWSGPRRRNAEVGLAVLVMNSFLIPAAAAALTQDLDLEVGDECDTMQYS